MKSSGIHIFSSTDEGYFPHFCGMLHSAWLYHPDANFYLLDAGISSTSLRRLKDFAALRQINLSIIDIIDRVAVALPDYQKRAAFGRVFIPSIAPEAIDRALYLDSDMTIVGDLRELFETDLGQNVIGACRDSVDFTIKKESEIQAIDFGERYFNSGMMLMDLKRWRERDLTDKVIAFARDYPDRLPSMDQSPLNVILLNDVKYVDRKWNYYHPIGMNKVGLNDLRIIHHINERPWLSALNPFAELYHYHRNQTPCPAGKKIELSFKQKIDRARRQIVARLWPSRYMKKAERYRAFDIVECVAARPALERAKAMVARDMLSR